MSIINTNMSSLNSQRTLTKSNADLSTSMQRLSSGLRVNSSKDDAAGMSIATKMDSQVRGMSQASRNANDGISMIQTADGALSNISDALQRMRELAVQAANGTNGDTEKSKIATEMSELGKEIGRIAGDTKFNGTALLSATNETKKSIQVGADANQTIDITIGSSSKFASFSVKTDYATAVPDAGGGTTPAPGAGDGTTPAPGAGDGTTPAPGAGDGTTPAPGAGDGTTPAPGAGDDTPPAPGAGDDTPPTTPTPPAPVAIDLSTTATSGKAIQDIDKALEALNNERASLGTAQNRMGYAIANLSTSIENQSAAKSRIMDTDYASETSKLSRAQILQQAGTAMLAQANSAPNNVMSLLRG